MKTVKKYKVFLMTEKGPITVEYSDDKPIAELENEILAKYGQFTTLHCQEIKQPPLFLKKSAAMNQ